MGEWVHLPSFFGTGLFGLFLVFITILLVEIFSKKLTPYILIGVFGASAILMDFLATRFGFVVLSGVPMVIAAGSMFWAILFLMQDYINEFYGKELARCAVYGMFFGKIIAALAIIWTINIIPNPPFPDLAATGEMFKTVMAVAPRIAISSIASSFCAGLFNVWAYDAIRIKTQGKHLWLRNNASSMGGMFIDAVIFTFGSFMFILPVSVILTMIVANLAIKWYTNILDTIFLYTMKYLKEKEFFGIAVGHHGHD